MRQVWRGVAVGAAVLGCSSGGDAPDDTGVVHTGDTSPGASEPAIGSWRAVVPSDGLPDGIAPLPANNNLDVVRWQGRVWLAWRTAPTHFASPETRMHVVSSADEVTWRDEGVIALGRDVREPQLVPTDEGLWLYVARLGTSALDFEPGGVVRAKYLGDAAWSEPEDFGPEGFIAWRIKRMAGAGHMLGYVGGGEIYDAGAQPLQVHWTTSDDGVTWSPAVGDDPVVLEGGGSETDAVLLDDGSLVAVSRNEAGDATGYGSKVCTAPAADLGTWTCSADPRKYDSPLLIHHGGRVWLVGRRTLEQDGNYDLGRDDLGAEARGLLYQTTYWSAPKRCALWAVDPDARSVTWVADLVGRGDTCFPEALDLGEGRFAVYSYTNDPDGPDWDWNEGQVRPTWVVRQEITLP